MGGFQAERVKTVEFHFDDAASGWKQEPCRAHGAHGTGKFTQRIGKWCPRRPQRSLGGFAVVPDAGASCLYGGKSIIMRASVLKPKSSKTQRDYEALREDLVLLEP
jgi:hypothetical protein